MLSQAWQGIKLITSAKGAPGKLVCGAPAAEQSLRGLQGSVAVGRRIIES